MSKAFAVADVINAREQFFKLVEHATVKDGCRLAYSLHGSSEAPHKVVLICGLSMAKEDFLPMIYGLTLKAPAEVQVLSFDNRGLGGSDAPWNGYSSQLMAQDALDLLDHLQWETPHIIGYRYTRKFITLVYFLFNLIPSAAWVG
jgi:pimeloyl-ACP methyl ester carboxylesterase